MYETNYAGNGWGNLWSAAVGGVVGYFVGRNNGYGYNGNCGGAACGAGCQTCFQQGEYSGENRAGINYIAQTVTANGKAIAELGSTIAQQKITDQANEIQALKTQAVVNANSCATNNQLSLINNQLASIITGCGVKSYPGCPNTCNC